MIDAGRRMFTQRVRPFTGYGLLLVGVAVAYLFIRAYGDTLPIPAAMNGEAAGVSSVHVNDFLHVLLALALVIATARGLGALFRLIHQPPVVGEMIAGILLGPSLLGQFAPSVSGYILPHSIAPLLNVISQVGVILYMFLVGLDLDLSALRERAHSTIAISHASIVAPFLLGAGLALVLYPTLSAGGVSFTTFSLFIGVSMSVTAFPVLARILSDRGIQKTKMGNLTLACAAIDDVSAWCLLALAVSAAQSRAGHALRTVVLALVYIAAMLLIVRPLMTRMTRLADTKGRLTQGALAFMLLAILLSSLATESIGIHSIFGAFVLGAIIPHDSSLARDITGKLEDFVIVFLLPAFFAFTGLRTQIGLVRGGQQWFFCGLIILVASIGKFGGSAIAARLSGLNWRDSSALGVLMNTRGLMELIVLNIGLELHVISPALFAMLVLMALTTTVATTPILHFIMPRRGLEQEAKALAAASRMAAAARDRSGTLVPLSNPNTVAALLDLAVSLTPPEGPPPRVLVMVRSAVTSLRSGLPETTELPPSRSPLLTAALDAAWSRGTVITPRAVLTSDPAREILQAAEQAQVRWLLLESRRSMFGHYPKRSVVGKVLEGAVHLPINVAVVLQSSPIVETPVVCLLDTAQDGVPALELATLLAQRGQKSARIFFVAADGPADSAIQDPKREWQKLAVNGTGASFVAASTAKQILSSVPEGLVIIAKDLTERFQTPFFDQLTRNRSVIIVQGPGSEATDPARSAVQLQPATA